MSLALFTGSANPGLAAAVAEKLGRPLGRAGVERFPDGELHVELRDSVRDHDVYLVQPTSPPAEAHLFEVLLLTDACRRAGADRVTAVIPYFGYARQDRRAQGRQPVAARLVANLLETAGVNRVVAIDLHSRAMEGVFGVPLEHLSAVDALAAAVGASLPEKSVVVACDLGATKLAERWARLLDLPTALVHKQRMSGSEVRVRDVTGEVAGRAPILVDDMISTGGTVAAAVQTLLAAGARPEVTIAATHALLVGDAVARLSALPLRRFYATDTVAPQTSAASLPLETVSIAPLIAETIRRLHEGDSLNDLLTFS